MQWKKHIIRFCLATPLIYIHVFDLQSQRSLMSEGQGLSAYFKGLSFKIIMFKFGDNPFKNNKGTASYSQKNDNFNNLTFKVKVIYE
jgi:hypothetical protein